MDCFLNCFIPKSTEDAYIIRPSGKTFVTGLAHSYSQRYDTQILSDYITKEEFAAMMNFLNEVVYTYWPCPLCFIIGYLFCPITCGLSFCFPLQCIKDAESNLQDTITYYNQHKLKGRKMRLVLRKKWSTSWIEMQLGKEGEDLETSTRKNRLQLYSQAESKENTSSLEMESFRHNPSSH
mmetsp:Transcript_44765/g.43354  ORF Transcript_44765/g.43354 Transcript_44765/m.43354 type:complete len:180 (+) Transcript_44765:26-565(+)